MSSEKPSLGEEIYSDASSFGKIWSLIGAVIGTIIGLGLFIFGLVFFFRKKTNRDEVLASVSSINGGGTERCEKISDNPVNYSCLLTFNYNYKGNAYNLDYNYNGANIYYKGQKTNIYVNVNHPTDILLGKEAPSWTGLIFAIVGIIIIAGGWFWYWMSRRYKFLAAAQGVGGAYNIISGRSGFI